MKEKKMKNKMRIPTLFGPETKFAVRAAPPIPFRVWRETEFERLKNKLARTELSEVSDFEAAIQVRCAANEAAALSWTTEYPLLVFPGLFEEKVAGALARIIRQKDIRERSSELSVM